MSDEPIFTPRIPPGPQIKVDGVLRIPAPAEGDGNVPRLFVRVGNGMAVNRINVTLGPLIALDETEGKILEEHFRNGRVMQGVMLEGPINFDPPPVIYRLWYWLSGQADPQPPIEVKERSRTKDQEPPALSR